MRIATPSSSMDKKWYYSVLGALKDNLRIAVKVLPVGRVKPFVLVDRYVSIHAILGVTTTV